MIFNKKVSENVGYYNYLAGHIDNQYVLLSKGSVIIVISHTYKFTARLFMGITPSSLNLVAVDENLTRYKKFIIEGLNVDVVYYYKIILITAKGQMIETPIYLSLIHI